MSSQNNFSITTRRLRDFSICGSVFVYLLLRLFVVIKGQAIGGAYFFSAYNLILLFLISVPWGLLEITARHTRERIENNLYKNAKRVMYFGFIIGVIYSVLICALIFLFRKGLCIYFLTGENCELCLILLLPLILFKSVSSVIKGFMLGSKLKSKLYTLFFIENLAMFICVFLCSNFFNSYGNNVANILYDEKIHSAFFAAGVALGLSMASFIGMILAFVFLWISDREMLVEDATKRMDDIYDLGSKMFSEVFVLGFSTMFCLSFNFVNQLLLKKYYGQDLTVSGKLCQFGTYYGGFWSIIICPMLFTFIYSFLDRRSIRVGFLDNNKSELRAKVSFMIKQFYAYALPFIAFVIINADLISRLLIGGTSQIATRLIRYGIAGFIFFGLSIIFMNVLIGLDRSFVNSFCSIIALGLDIVVVYMCLNKTNLGLYSLIIGFYTFAFILSITGYLFTTKYLKFKIKMFNTIVKPLIAGVIVGIITFLFKLLMGLFAPDLITIIITGILAIIVSFVLYVRMHAFTFQAIKRSALGGVLVPLGRMLGLFKKS